MAPSGAPFQQFRSCLLVSNGEESTLHFIKAVHGAGLAVLERQAGPSALALAVSGGFDLVAWVASPSSHFDTPILTRIAQTGAGLVVLLRNATPAAVSACLLAGADACLQMDADARVIVAQVLAVIRRKSGDTTIGSAARDVVDIGDLRVDSQRCTVERCGLPLALTASEFRIIEYMARHPFRTLRPHEILNAISDGYQYSAREAQDVFKVYVRRIRRKLEPQEDDPSYLITVRGFGYRLEAGRADAQRESQTA